MPLEGGNVDVGEPLRRMEKKANKIKVRTHLIQSAEKPKAARIALMNY